MAPDPDPPQYITMREFYMAMAKVEHRITRLEVLVGTTIPFLVGIVLKVFNLV